MHTAILSQMRTEPQFSNVNTKTEALDIQGQTILNLTLERKDDITKTILTPATQMSPRLSLFL